MCKNPRKYSKAFTLIELMVVISIIGMLSSVVLVATQSARDKGRIGAGNIFDGHTYRAFGADAIISYDFNSLPINDMSGNANVPVVNGPGTITLAAGINSTSGLDLGVSSLKVDSINASQSVLSSVNNSGSISFWVFPKSILGGSNGQYDAIVSLDGTMTYISLGSSIGQTFIGLWPHSPYTGAFTDLTSSIPISSVMNRWNHVLVSWNGSNVKLYVDGKLSGSANDFSNPSITSKLYLGSNARNSQRSNVLIDNFRFYSQSLQTAQVEKIYAEESVKYHLASVSE